MLRNMKSDRRGLVVGGARAAALTAAAGAMGLPAAALAQEGEFGPPRKFIWVPQALGDWDLAFQVGARDFCEMVGWEYQRIGNPVYSVQNHAEQVNNAIAAQADAIATSLESVGLVQPFERGLDQGIAMIITDQGIQEEADALGLHVINQDEFNAGIINGTQAATFAHELTGKTEGIIVLGNGNPGSTSIDKRQNGSKLGIEQYNAANGTSYQFEAFPDSSFGELTESIQKWTAQIDEKGDQLVAAIGTGNPNPIVQALKERGMEPGTIAVGSTDIPPAHQQQIAEGWVQWGIDQQFYVMGFMCAAGAWVQLERGYPYLDIRTGGEVVLDKDLERVEARTEIWLGKAREYGFA
jgi:ribose transport system substrate-binding protein